MYQTVKLRKLQSVAELDRSCAALHHVFGADIHRNSNLCYLGGGVICYSTAAAVVIEDINLHTKKYLLGIDECGVGCVAVHPSRFVYFMCA